METAIYNSTINGILAKALSKSKNLDDFYVKACIACYFALLFAGVSIASVARRLGHSSMTTTQHTYLHIIQELKIRTRILLCGNFGWLVLNQWWDNPTIFNAPKSLFPLHP